MAETVKLEIELPSNMAMALTKVASLFSLNSNELAVFLLEWQLDVETDMFFKNLIDEKVEHFLLGNCWDHETIQHVQTEIKDILRGKT